jgi:hypothetical protein
VFPCEQPERSVGMSDPQIFSIRQRLYTDSEGGGAVDKKTEKLDQGMFYLLTPNILRSKPNSIIANVTSQLYKLIALRIGADLPLSG